MRRMHIDGRVDSRGSGAVRQLAEDEVCRSVRYFRQLPSTNAQAMNDIQQDGFDAESLPCLYLTDHQTSGRGRLGRTWVSHEGTLTFSLVISTSSFPGDVGLLPLAVGVGVAQAVEHTCAPYQAKLKWPNDVYLSGAKVAGILVEASQSQLDVRVIGVGINIGGSPTLPDSSQSPPVTSLADVVGRPLSRYDFLQPVLCSVTETIADLARESESIVQGFRSRCFLTKQQVSLSTGRGRVTGACHGITDQGQLMIETEQGVGRYHSGEASRVRVPSTNPQRSRRH